MKFKLKQLIVENFKAFKRRIINIESSNLSLLDGPNGFGKTSFYDALELLFLGKVERYIDIEKQTTYGRKSTKSYPLMFDRAEYSDSVLIQLLIELSTGEIITLKRTASCSSLKELKQLNDAVFQLEVFKDDDKIEFNNEVKVLSHLLGDNYQHNYRLFHYIEQEENTALLKSRATDKQDKIDHLFDVSDYRTKISKLAQIRKNLSPLKTESKKRELASLNSEILKLESELSQNSGDAEQYFRLIHSTEQPWDKESVKFESGSYSYWLGGNGELEKISNLKKAETEFINNRYNINIKKEFSLIDRVMIPLLKYGHRIDLIPKYQKEVKLYECCFDYLSLTELGTFKLILENKALPQTELISILTDKIDFTQMKQSIEDIRAQNSTSTALTQSLNKLKASQDIYISEYVKYRDLHKTQDAFCPTCGHDWKKHDDLIKQFDKQKLALSVLLEGQGTILKVNIDTFERNYLDIIKIECNKIIEEEKTSNKYKKNICELNEEKKIFLTQLKQKYFDYKIDLSDLYIKSFDINEVLQTSQLEERVSSYYKPVNYECLRPEFDDLFKVIFNENTDALKNIALKNIENKIRYISQKFSESRLLEIGVKKEKYKVGLAKFDEASQLDKNLMKLVKLYNDNINNYITSISQGIEILFHIYSGRLLQNFQNGLGVFIDTDGKSVSFKDTPNSEHDVIFSMSSGQLSSLVIAFTLALNHKYAKNDLLLIDDPIQTMDEINVAGFIDLLRYQFKNRQIFISTHEDHTSSYFRYKFNKAGLEQERINFKELSKIETDSN
ncbi:MAG: exonuclease SbcC [Colwellia sp.]|jgi:exonuclease SbcC